MGTEINKFSENSNITCEFNKLLLAFDPDNMGEDVLKNVSELHLQNSPVEQLINELLKIIPEWKKIIGLRQHVTHDFTLDVHTLLVFRKVKESEMYFTLEKTPKLILLYTALLHDIDKMENEVDPEHPKRGAEMAVAILSRLGFQEDFVSDVFILIKNHQILGLMAANRMELNMDRLIDLLHKPELLKMLIILTIADIKSVKKDEKFFCETVKNNIDLIKKEFEQRFELKK